jgi:hypothetical protein
MNAPAPGLRRPMDMGQIIEGAIRLYRLNFGEFLAIAAVTLPASAAGAIVGGFIGNAVASIVVTAFLAIPSVIIGIIAQAAIALGVAGAADGVAPHFESIYGRVLPRVGALLLTALRVFVVVMALFVTIIGIPFGVYLAVRWAFFTQAVIIEGESSTGAIDLSARIVKGYWWRTLGILVMLAILASLPTAAVSLIFAAASPVAANLAVAVVGVIVFPFSAGAITLLFFDLQSRERERVSIA